MTENSGTSLSLLERVRGRDQDAWQRLVALYGPLVVYWCQRSSVSAEDAQDVSQDVFLAIAGGLEQFQHQRPGSFRAWVRGITRHKVLDHFRRGLKQPEGGGGTDHYRLLQEVPEAEDTADEASQVSGLYHRALNLIRTEFQERTWLAFWNAAVEGRETSVVAAELNMTPVAVRIAKSRVLSRLREEVGDLIE